MTRFSPGSFAWTALVLTLAWAAPCSAEGADAWRELAPGLEFGRFAAESAAVDVLRIDPELWQTVALAASDTGGVARTPERWAREFGLTAVINAGMYAADRSTHVGYFHTGEHVNNPVWIRRDYRQAACFEPREAGLAPFVLMDLDAAPESTFVHRYDIVVQNLRLVRKPAENRWKPGNRRWSEACLGEDAVGRMLWIHCLRPHDMHAFNEILLGLPLDLAAAQHLEGGAEAQLWIDYGALDGGSTTVRRIVRDIKYNSLSLPIPNVLGIRPRATN